MKRSTAPQPTLLTTPLISRPWRRAFPCLSLRAIAARLAATIVSLKPLTELASTRLPPLQTMWLSAARTSATLTPAPMPRIGIPATLLRLVPRFPTFPKFPGMTHAQGSLSRLMRVTPSLTAHRVFATTLPSAFFCRLRLPAVVVPANARRALRPSMVLSAARARVGLNPRGNRSSVIPTMVCATRRTSRSLPLTVCGATSMFSAGRTLLRAGRPAAPILALGPERAEPLSLLPSWRASKRSSTKKPGARKAIPLPFIIRLPPQNTGRAAAVPVIQITGMPLARAAFSTT